MNSRIQNKLGGQKKRTGAQSLMSLPVIVALLVIGVFSFGALITLSGFADDLKQDNRGEAHVLSRSAIGYAGIMQLLTDQGWETSISRSEARAADKADELYVYTFTRTSQLSVLDDIDLQEPTLIVLPKWVVARVGEQADVVRPLPFPVGPVVDADRVNLGIDDLISGVTIKQRNGGALDPMTVEGQNGVEWIASDIKVDYLQHFGGSGFTVKAVADGVPVLIQIPETRTFILSDPDFLNTSGISLRRHARLGQEIIKSVIYETDGYEEHVVFDLNVHGFANTQNLVKLLLTPPFLAATLCLLAAAALVIWQAFTRFGDPREEVLDYELGKYTLVDNGARFIRIAEKETGMSEGYVALTRRLAAEPFGLERKSVDDIEAFFETRETNTDMQVGWSHYKNRLLNVRGKEAFLKAAQALYKWKGDITHDSR